MNAEDLKKYEQILFNRKTQLEKELAAIPLVTEMGNESEGMTYDTEADEAEEMTTNYALRKSLQEELDGVKRALTKIESGTYGKCEQCGGEIDKDVLSALPESKLCKTCKM